jgi:hypothetical protein
MGNLEKRPLAECVLLIALTMGKSVMCQMHGCPHVSSGQARMKWHPLSNVLSDTTRRPSQNVHAQGVAGRQEEKVASNLTLTIAINLVEKEE